MIPAQRGETVVEGLDVFQTSHLFTADPPLFFLMVVDVKIYIVESVLLVFGFLSCGCLVQL